MPRAAAEVMQSILFSAVLDAIAALKSASRGLPNQLVRDLQAIHPNTTFADLPKELQDAIAASTRSAFTQMLKEGYAIGPKGEQRPTRPLDRVPDRQRREPRHGTGERRPRRTDGPPRRPQGEGPGGGGEGPGKGPAGGPGGKPRRPRPAKGKPRLS